MTASVASAQSACSALLSSIFFLATTAPAAAAARSSSFFTRGGYQPTWGLADSACFAGFVRRLPTINVHPSLLPAFPGLDGIEQALRYGVRLSGVTVHLVDEGLDTGPVLMQDAVPVHYDDSAESLHERLRPVEHRLLVEAVLALASDRVAVKGRSVAISSVEGA